MVEALKVETEQSLNDMNMNPCQLELNITDLVLNKCESDL